MNRIALNFGVAGPLLFAAAVVVVGTLRGDYDHINQFISELGETGGQFAWVMNWLGFVPAGVLILAFVVGARSRVPRGTLNVIGTVFLCLFAVCLSLAGIFSCDLGCSPANPTPEQRLHDLVSIIAFPAFILGVVAWGAPMVVRKHWHRFGWYSIATGVVALVVLVAMVQSEPTRNATGLFQRLFLATLFGWLIALSIRLRRETGDPRAG